MGKILELIRLTWDVIFNKKNAGKSAVNNLTEKVENNLTEKVDKVEVKGGVSQVPLLNYKVNDFENKSITNQIAEVEKLVEGKTIIDDKKLENIGYMVIKLTKKNKSSRSELENKLIIITKNGLIKKIIDPQLQEFVAKSKIAIFDDQVDTKIKSLQKKIKQDVKKYPREMDNDNNYKHTKPAIGIEARLKEKDRYDRDILYYNPVCRRVDQLRQKENGQTVLHAEVQETMVQETMRRPRQGENETEQEFKTRVTNYEREMEYAKENYKILYNEVKQEDVNNLTWNVEIEFMKHIQDRTTYIRNTMNVSDEMRTDTLKAYRDGFEYNPNLVPLSLPTKQFHLYFKFKYHYSEIVEEKYKIRSDAAQVNTTVTNSNINATNSNTNVTNSNTKATNSNTKATNSNTKATNSNTKATNSNTKATNSNTKATNSNTKATNSNTKATNSNTKATNSNTKATNSNTNVTNSNTEATNSNTEATNSNTKTTNSNTNVTNSNTNVTNSNTNVTNSNTKTTNSNTNVTNSNTNVTNSNTNVTKINCAIEEQLEMLNSMTLLTLIGIVVIGVLAISISNKSRIFSSVIKGLSLENKKNIKKKSWEKF